MWRPLTEAEISQLVQQNNFADDWGNISVARNFSIQGIYDCRFYGNIKLEENVTLLNSTLLNYHIGCATRIANVQQMWFSRERYAYPLELCNEDGRYRVNAVPKMNSTDVFQSLHTSRPDFFEHEAPSESMGYIGPHSNIENIPEILNLHVEEFANLKNCRKVSHVWISSDGEEGVFVGHGVILDHVIVNKGTRIDTNANLQHVLVGQQVSISDGARVYQSAIGDNSHIAGCEIGHSFLYPCHEQHHSNSFLIAAHIQGQSNVAAGATLGSNHNGRKNDVDLVAGRGFWPGLCTSLAFPCSFAPYALIAKGDYPRPLRIPFAFSLINNNVKDDCLEIMPAFWWMHNAYAMMRNEWKYEHRDKRKDYTQYFDYRALAPDTIHVVVENHRLLTRHLAGEAKLPKMEMSSRPVRILKEKEAVAAYREMMLCYVLAEGVFHNKPETLIELSENTNLQWINAGGNILTTGQWAAICNSSSLKESHELQLEYVDENSSFVHLQDAICVLDYLCDGEVTIPRILSLYREAIDAQIRFYERVIEERKKDLASEFRQTNTMFPTPSADIFDDPICQQAATEIAKLERTLHT